MKLQLNKNEIKLVRILMIMSQEQLDEAESLMNLVFGESTDSFAHTYKTLEHKLLQQTGKDVSIPSSARMLVG